MTPRENLLSLLRRQGYDYIPATFSLCPSLEAEYKKQTGGKMPYQEYFSFPWKDLPDIRLDYDPDIFRPWYDSLKPGTHIGIWGTAHEPGSEAAKHMTRMRHPLSGIEDLEKIKEYPFPDFKNGDASQLKQAADAIHARGMAAVANLQCTIWEVSWYLRSMEDLFVDMMTDDPIAEFIFDKVTEQNLIRIRAAAEAGADIVYLGDDIGMQHTAMMSHELYRKWIKPRLKKVIAAIREINPDALVFYHSCGMVTPFIDDLIDAGIDVLNPIQSECMNPVEIIKTYGDRLSFYGAVGTQTTMPFGTPEEIIKTVHSYLDAAGPNGGMLVAPTHLLEPEVPWENILAFVEACKTYQKKWPRGDNMPFRFSKECRQNLTF